MLGRLLLCSCALLGWAPLTPPLAAQAVRTPSFMSYPLHASCQIVWTTQEGCETAQAALRQAAESMGTGSDCGGGEKCNYAITEDSKDFLKLTHVTPTTPHYTDTQTVNFEDTSTRGGCTINAKSSSNTFYAYLDNGTNYCNLHNLIDATALRYSEETDVSKCTQYDLPPDCEVN